MSSSTMTFELSSLGTDESPHPILEQKGTAEDTSRAQNHPPDAPNEIFSTGRAAAVIVTVAGVNFLNATGSGILTVALPTIAKDLGLSKELLLW